MKQYLEILDRIMLSGEDVEGRNGMTRSIFGTQIFSHDMSTGFPLLTTKHVNFHIVKAELLWFLSGSTNENDFRKLLGGKWLKKEANVYKHPTIWSKNAADFKKRFPEVIDGDLGLIYGAQWRRWVDQIGDLVQSLRQDPSSRRHVVSAWNPADLHRMALPPCHMMFQCKVRKNGGNELDLCMIQRSCDMFLGVPFNIASYGLLLKLLAKVTKMRPRMLHIHLLDAHIYHEHFDAVAEQLKRDTLPMSWVNLNAKDSIFDFGMDDIFLEHYVSEPAIKARMIV